MKEIYLHTLNGLTVAMLVFLVASGLTVIFGLMRVINLSHGALYLLGGYIGFAVEQETGSIFLAALAGLAAVGVLGALMHRLLARQLHGDELGQVLLTLGIALIVTDVLLWTAGGTARSIPEPGFLAGSVSLPADVDFPAYRIALIVLGLAVAGLLWAVWRRTKIGALLRAGVDDSPTLEALGVNVGRVFTLTFAAGAALAAFAGVIGAPILGLNQGLDFDLLLLSFVVVVIGGAGSLTGAFVGSILVGLVDAYSKAYVPELSFAAVFGPAVVVLALRPGGLFGTSES